MRPSPHRIRRTGLGLVLAAVLVLFTAPPAHAAFDPGSYGFMNGQGTFTRLTANNLMPAGGSRQVFYLSTAGTGLHRLPFRLHLFNQFYANIAISSSGNIQPGITSGANPTDIQECLPTDDFLGRPSVEVLWGELVFNGASGIGVFLRTQGTAPHRTFTVSWQGFFAVSAPTTANAQVTFREDSQNIVYQYGPTTFQNLVTIGIQSKQRLSWATRYCDAMGMYPTNGTRLTLVHM